jgi:hypothetical protein
MIRREMSDRVVNRRRRWSEHAIGQLDGIASHMPAPERFLYAFVRKEALIGKPFL